MKKYFILTAAAMLVAGMTAFAQMSVGAGYVNSSSTVRAGKNSSGSTSALRASKLPRGGGGIL